MLEDPEGSVVMIDSLHQTPELIWTKDIQTEVKKHISDTMTAWMDKVLTHEKAVLMGRTATAPALQEVSLQVQQLASEVQIGGVYVNLFLTNPNYSLRQPRAFLEALIDKYREYLVLTTKGIKQMETTWAVRDTESLLNLLTKCIIALLQAQPAVADHAATTGQLNSIMVMMAANKGTLLHPTLLSILHALCDSRPCVEALGLFPQTMMCFSGVMKKTKDADVMEVTISTLEKLVIRNNCSMFAGCLVDQVCSCVCTMMLGYTV